MGLQLLLQPASSAVVFRAACSVVGVVYPAYESLKTVESGHLERHQAHQVREDAPASFRSMLSTVTYMKYCVRHNPHLNFADILNNS